MRVIIDSVSGATAMNCYATVTIVYAPTADSLYTNLVGTALESAVVESAYHDLAGAIQSKLASTNVTIGGQSQSLSSALSGHIDVSAKVKQY